MSVTLSQKLVEIARRPATAADRARAARHLLDWIGCIAVAQTSPAGKAALKYAGASSLGAVFSPSMQSETAAFATGAVGNVLEMDDLDRASLLHVGDVVCPAALAVALAQGVQPNALLDSILSGYEVAIRIGRAAAASGYAPWYNSATCGVFGAAMASARLLKLGGTQTADALTQAGMMASGLWQCRLDPGTAKQLATANAARSGVAAAQLAQAGFTGPARMLEGELGFFAVLYPNAVAEDVLATGKEAFLIHDVSLKPWPACRHTHPAIAAALQLDQPETVARLDVRTYGAALDFCNTPNPQTDHEARFSLQHCVAVAFTRGAPGLDDFSAEARADPALAAWRARVFVSEDAEDTAAFPQRLRATLTATHQDGTTETICCPTAPGDPEDPMSEDALIAKARRNLIGGGASPDAADHLISYARDLPSAENLNAFAHALRSALSPERNRHDGV